MADPSLIPDGAGDIVKVGGSGGVGMVLMALMQRFFNKADKDDGKLDQILAAVQAMNGRLDVQHERQTSTRADVDKLEAGLLQMQLQMAELRGQFQHLNESIAR